MDRKTIKAIIDQYAKHGWQLRRALLTDTSVEEFLTTECPDAKISQGENAGLWFSRRSLPDREAWELRRIAGSPFALVAVIEDDVDEAARDAVLMEIEQRMFDGSRPEPLSH